MTGETGGAGRASGPPAAAVEVVVAYADTDAQGRVYYGRYSRYLDAARFAVWEAAGFDEAALRRLEHDTVLARLEIEYHGPAEFHDRLRVEARVEAVGRTSLTLRYAITHVAAGRPVLDARQVLVQIDPGDGRPRPWSEADRERLVRLA